MFTFILSFPSQSNFLKIIVYTLVSMFLFHFSFLACCNIYSTEATLLKLPLLKTQKILLLLSALDLFSVLNCTAFCLCAPCPGCLASLLLQKPLTFSWFFICLSRQTFPMSFLFWLVRVSWIFLAYLFLSPRHTPTGHFIQSLFLVTIKP